MPSSASLSLSCTLLSACSSCRSLSVLWTSSPPCVPPVWESSGDRGTQSSSCVCVSVHIFLWVFFLSDIQASQDGWNGVTARFSHLIFSFCPCLHSSNPTGVVYGSVWQEKKQFSRGKERDYLHFTFSSSCDDNWTHPKWFLYAHRGLWIFNESGHMDSGIILGCNWQ